MKSNFRKIIIVSAIFISAFFLTACSWQKPANPVNNEKVNNNTNTQSENGLKTYRNEKFGFSFQYPSVWHISECTGNNLRITITKDAANCSDIPWYDAIVNIYEEKIIKNINEIKKDLQQDDQYKEKNIVVDNLNILQVEGIGSLHVSSGSPQKIIYSFIPLGDHFLDIYMVKQEDFINGLSVINGYNKIINTFKFDNKN